MVFVEPTTCLTANCAVLGALASASPDPAELRLQYAGLVSAQNAMAVVAFNREVDDDFLTVDIDGPAVWHLTHQPPPLIVGTMLSSSAAYTRHARKTGGSNRPDPDGGSRISRAIQVFTFASVMEP